MLLDSLYTIKSLEHKTGLIVAGLELQEDHPIFQSHFPGKPVLPGACMVQMVKEIFQMEMNESLQLQKANAIKFLQMIQPHENKILQLQIQFKEVDESNIQVNASINSHEKLCFKLTGIYKKE